MKNWNKHVFLTAAFAALLGAVPAHAQDAGLGTKESFGGAIGAAVTAPPAAAEAPASPEVYVVRQDIADKAAIGNIYLANGPINMNGGAYIGAESGNGTKAQEAVEKVYTSESSLPSVRADTSASAYNESLQTKPVVVVKEIDSPYPGWFGKSTPLPNQFTNLAEAADKATKELPPAASLR